MMRQPSIELGDWKPNNQAPWEKEPYCFVSDIDVVAVGNDYIDRHVNRIETPVRLVDSYRSYVIQVLKDIDYLITCIRKGYDSFEPLLDYCVDVSLERALPWRFTPFALRFIADRCQEIDLISYDGDRLWGDIKPIVDDAFENGTFYRIEKYIKVSHVVLDIAFDIGWDEVYSKASALKEVEGLTSNPERAATLREASLYLAKNFWHRGFHSAGRNVLFIGFPDTPDSVSLLTDSELDELLKLHPRQAVQQLLNSHSEETVKNVTCSQIVEGAMRVISRANTG